MLRQLLRIGTVVLVAVGATFAGHGVAHANPPTTVFVHLDDVAISTVDDDSPFGFETGTETFGSSVRQLNATSTQPHPSTSWFFSSCPTGDEVRLEATVTATYSPLGNTPRVIYSVSLRLFEGASCATTDLDGTRLDGVTIEANEGSVRSSFPVSTLEDAHDSGKLFFTAAATAF
jgi:hypothetical protein